MAMKTTKLVLGDTADISLMLNGASVGETYIVDVQILRPDGIILSHQLKYEIIADVRRRAKSV